MVIQMLCSNCNHNHYLHGSCGRRFSRGCIKCSCKNCKCKGCVKYILKSNPPSSWHQEKMRVARITYKKEQKDRQFYLGYVKAHMKFIEIEGTGREPDYDKYVKMFMQRYYDAKGNDRISFYAGCRLAAIESRSAMANKLLYSIIKKGC